MADLSYGPARGIIAVSPAASLSIALLNHLKSFSLTPATPIRVKLPPGPIVRSAPRRWSGFSSSGRRITSACGSAPCRSARSTKLRFMISKSMLASSPSWTQPSSSSGWTWRLTRTSTASRCIYRTSQRWWKTLRTNSRSFPSSSAAWNPTSSKCMAKSSLRTWPIRRTCSSSPPTSVIGAAASATRTTTSRPIPSGSRSRTWTRMWVEWKGMQDFFDWVGETFDPSTRQHSINFLAWHKGAFKLCCKRTKDRFYGRSPTLQNSNSKKLSNFSTSSLLKSSKFENKISW